MPDFISGKYLLALAYNFTNKYWQHQYFIIAFHGAMNKRKQNDEENITTSFHKYAIRPG